MVRMARRWRRVGRGKLRKENEDVDRLAEVGVD